jgi:uncharacterized membrane protein YfcA
MTTALLLIILGALAAGLVQGLSGFAYGLTAMAFWAWTVDPRLAGPMVVVGSLIGQLITIAGVRKGFRLIVIAPFVIGGVIGVPLGVMLLRVIDPTVFKAAVGAVLAVYCPVMLFARELPQVKPRWPALADGAVGALGGAMGGLGGFSGVSVTLWATLRGFPADTQRAAIQSFNLAMHIVTLSVYAAGGLITAESMQLCALTVGVALVPTLIGLRLYTRFDALTFRRLVLSLLALSGVALLAAAVPALIQR